MKAIYQCTCDSLIFGTCHCVGYSAGINTQTTEQVQGLVKRLVTREVDIVIPEALYFAS